MALTGLTNLQPLHVHSIGISTFDGSVSVGGTLTYEDVTNVDSIGIITARNGINVSSGTATFQGLIDANGDLDVDGHTELDNINISGVSTHVGLSQFQNTINLTHASAGQNYIYFNEDLQFAKNGTGTRLKIDSSGRLYIGATSGGNPDTDDLVISGSGKKGITICSTDGSESRLTFADGLSGVNAVAGNITYTHSNDSLDFYTATTRRLRITSNGHLLLGTDTDYADNNSDDLQIYGTGHTGMSITSGTSHYGSIYFGDSQSGDSRNRGIVRYDHTNNNMEIWTNAVERLRISSGGSIGVSHDLSGIANYNRLMLNNPHDGSCWLQMTSTASGNGANTDGLSIGLNSSNVAHIWQRENAKMMFATNGTSRMEISANGIVTKPNTPAFRAHDSNHAQNGFLTFDQIATNVGSHYNGSNGRFTVPIAGTYFFSFYGMLATSSGNARVEYYINGSVHSSGEHYGGVAYTNNQTYNMITCNTVLTLSQNDYVNLNWNASYNSMHSYHNGFMGFLIG